MALASLPNLILLDLRFNSKLRGAEETLKVGRCRMTVSKPVLKAPMVSALEAIQRNSEALSNFAFKFNLRRYIKVALPQCDVQLTLEAKGQGDLAGLSEVGADGADGSDGSDDEIAGSYE